MNDFIDRHETFLANLGAFIMTFLMLTFICYTAKGSQPRNTQTVVLIEHWPASSSTEYTHRIIEVLRTSDAHAVVCLKVHSKATPPSRAVVCFYAMNNSTEVVAVPELIAGEDNT